MPTLVLNAVLKSTSFA